MSYPSVDALQKTLAETVFKYAADKKKAAGRALGTLVEIITFYTLKSWGLRNNIAIERPLPEYANPGISHNVEYSLHPIIEKTAFPLEKYVLPLTSSKLRRELFKTGAQPGKLVTKDASLLSLGGILRNACTLCETDIGPYVASIDARTQTGLTLTIAHLHKHPFAIFECKRVGVEEGMKKGPQTIEKAKQGAYVARSVSGLQKIRLRDGSMAGVIHLSNGDLYHGPYHKLLRDVIDSNEADLLSQFILTAVRKVFGGKIDLDPCSNAHSIVDAEVEYHLPLQDGLKESWNYPKIFVNPPYGIDQERGTSIKHWLYHCATANRGHDSEVLALVPVATNTGHWKNYVFGRATGVCFLYDTRLKFLVDGRDEGKGAPMSCAMIYWGKNYDRFFEVFIRYGAVLDFRPLYGKQIGEYDRIVEPVLLSEF